MILAILQARMSSTRLPEKVLKPILGQPMLMRQLERVQRSQKIDKVIVATSMDKSDDPIAKLCQSLAITCFRGDLNDVLDRYYQAAKLYPADHIVRLTGDCPLSDPTIIDVVIMQHLAGNYDYTSNTLEPTYPDGLDVEVIRSSCLEKAWRKALLPSHREHVTPYIYSQPDEFKLCAVVSKVNLSHLRWTVDTQTDFDLVSKIYEALYEKNVKFGMSDILNFLKQHPDLETFNTEFQRNEGLQKSLLADQQFLKEKQNEST